MSSFSFIGPGNRQELKVSAGRELERTTVIAYEDIEPIVQ
jgi:hypothetical protein